MARRWGLNYLKVKEAGGTMAELIGGLYIAGCVIVVLAMFQYNKLAAVVFTIAFFMIFRSTPTIKPTATTQTTLKSVQVATPIPLFAQTAPEATTLTVQFETEGILPQPQLQPEVTQISQPAQIVQTVSQPRVQSASCCLWPVPSSKRVTQQPRAGHTALDIGAATGQPAIAAAAGRVTTRGWSNVGYGNHIILDHGNGVQTLYAHFSEYIAGYGEEVQAGQVVGLIGSTGKSTGPHLHFEVRINGVLQNPWKYLK